ncbi:MAG: hydroxyacid dehydrogenase, partial [Bacteroidota bacterium]
MAAKKIKMVYLDAESLGDVDLSPIARLGELKVHGLTSEEEKIERMQGYPVVIVNKLMIDKNSMDACPDLKLICISATGMNNIDLDYAKEKGIEVKNVAGYSTESVAQWTFGMLFYLLHQTRYYDDFVKSGTYAQHPLFTHMDRS